MKTQRLIQMIINALLKYLSEKLLGRTKVQ